MMEKEKNSQIEEGELSDDDLGSVAGGDGSNYLMKEMMGEKLTPEEEKEKKRRAFEFYRLKHGIGNWNY